MPVVAVRTKGGFVTEYRAAWYRGDRPVWTWRCDGEQPLDFGTVELASQWIEEVYVCSTKKERDADGWAVVVLE